MEIRSNSMNSLNNGRPSMNYGNIPTGNMSAYSHNVINHGQRTEGVNHQTHPDRLNHQQRNNFGR